MDKEPSKPYVYQPYGIGGNGSGRLWGVSGVHRPFDLDVTVTIKGLTRVEAEAVRDALIDVQEERAKEKAQLSLEEQKARIAWLKQQITQGKEESDSSENEAYIVRLDGEEIFDELIVPTGGIHIERMDNDHWWAGITVPGLSEMIHVRWRGSIPVVETPLHIYDKGVK